MQVQPRLTVAAFDSGLRKTAPPGSVDARRAARAASEAPNPARRGDPSALVAALAARGIPSCVAPDGTQGDDVLASLAAAAADTPLRVLVASGDADMQCALRRRDAAGAGGCDWLRVAPHPSARHPAVLELVTWQARLACSSRWRARCLPSAHPALSCADARASRMHRKQSFLERYGFVPERYAALGALRGRPRDAVPACRGVGDRAAAALVRAYGDVDAMLQAAGTPRISLAMHEAARASWLQMISCLGLTRHAAQRTASCAASGPRWPPRC